MEPDTNEPATSLVDVLRQAEENRAAIKEVHAMLEDLLIQQASLSSTQRMLEQRALLHAMTNLGKHGQSGAWPPPAALLVHRVINQWKSFAASSSQENGTSIQLSPFLDSVLGIIEREGGDVGAESNDPVELTVEGDAGIEQPHAGQFYQRHSYWLVTSLTLLALFPAPSKATEQVSAVGALGRHLKGLYYNSVHARSSLSTDPALGSSPPPPPVLSSEETRREMFRSRLHGAAINSYSSILATLKKEITSTIPSCVQVLPQSRVASPSFDSSSSLTVKRSAWSDLIVSIDACMKVMSQQGLEGAVVDVLLSQALHFLDVTVFNQLLLRPECCLLSNARHMQGGLEDLDTRLSVKQPTPMTRGMASNVHSSPQQELSHLRHSRQALAFLCHPRKESISVKELREFLCPSLSPQQMYRLATVSLDDVGDGGGMVDGEILEDLKAGGGSWGNGGLIVTFLIEEDLTPAISPNGKEGQVLPEVISSLVQGEGRGVPSLMRGLKTPLELLSIPGSEVPFEFLQKDLGCD